jgi:hypothetical protein
MCAVAQPPIDLRRCPDVREMATAAACPLAKLACAAKPEHVRRVRHGVE